MSIDANRVRDWFQSNRPDFPEEDIESLLDFSKSNGNRKNANWDSVKSAWSDSLLQSGKITSKAAKEEAKSILGDLFNDAKYGMAFKRWRESRGLSQVEQIGNLRVYAEDFLPNTPMGKIKGLVQSNKPVDLASILKNHRSLVKEANEYLSQSGYGKQGTIWRRLDE